MVTDTFSAFMQDPADKQPTEKPLKNGYTNLLHGALVIHVHSFVTGLIRTCNCTLTILYNTLIQDRV